MAKKTKIRFNLGDDWRLESDGLQWIIKRRKTPDLSKRKDPGGALSRREDAWKAEAYHPTLNTALVALHRRMPLQLTGEYSKDGLEPLLDTLDRMEMAYKEAIEVMKDDANRAK